MGDGVRSPENVVKKGIQVAVAGAFLAEAVAGCVPSQAASGLSADRSKNTSDKVSTIPTPPSLLTPDTTVYPFVVPAKSTIDSETRQITNANLLQLQNYLGFKEEDVKKYLETGSNKGIESFQVLPGGIIIAIGGPNGYTDKESIQAIKDAVGALINIDPEIMKQLSKLGLRAIARNIPGYGSEGFFGHEPQNGFSFSFDPTKEAKSGVMLDNPKFMKDKVAYKSGIIEESYGIAYWKYLKLTTGGYIIPEEHTFKGEERAQKIEFIKQWFKENEFELSFLPATYKYLKGVIETEGYEKLFQDIRITKALITAGIIEKSYKKGNLSEVDYERLKEDFYYNFRQDIIDLAQ